ncbi:ABC transporter permease [Antrihabitans cavernicola]|uniref:Transport permease protein n=1 Tax=Antrihabitans cavernicola TaxID=2495913 RepID=A0A5A7SGA6_9NOCA|nr:ABC transporter permease [Spelaeibacter cavernicola]KAA0023663.1 peptide ABC transporter permease [Spelaeibacter cavernicola]
MITPTRPATDATFPTRRGGTSETSARSLIGHTLVQVQRLLLRWTRDPMTLMQALLFPALLLVMLNTVLGRQISAFAGHSALYGTVPMTALVGVMSGSVAGAVTMGRERDAGLLARFWVLPVHRASGLVSRIVAEAVRILACTVVIVGVGYVMGFRFDQGVHAALAFLAIPLMYGLAFATMVTAVALFTAKATLVEAISLGSSLLMFFSTGFVPLAAYPPWASPIVAHQPLTCATDAMRALALGGDVSGPLIATTAWSVGAIVVFAVPAAIGYRRASRR